MAEPRTLEVTIVLAEPARQRVVALQVPAGTTAWQAVSRSGLLEGRDDLEDSRLAVAVWGRQVARERRLAEGDRVEILRPLQQDPKDRRRRLARRGNTRPERAD